MKKVLYYLDHYFEEAILSCFVAYFVFATALQVFARLVLKVSMPWTEETSRYTLIWMTVLGSAFAAKKGTHIRVDILETSIHKGRGIVRVISYAIFLVFTVVMTVVGIQICVDLLAMPQYSTVLHIPMLYIYLALPVGMGLTTFRVLQKMWCQSVAKKKGGEWK